MNSTLSKCDLCGRRFDECDNWRGTLKGLCRNCSLALESGKASARIVVAESKAMAARTAERRVSRGY